MKLKRNKIAIFGSGQIAKTLSLTFKNSALIFCRPNFNAALTESMLMMRLRFLLDNQNVFCIINCIGMNNIEECERNRELAYHINVIFPKILAKYCISKGIILKCNILLKSSEK